MIVENFTSGVNVCAFCGVTHLPGLPCLFQMTVPYTPPSLDTNPLFLALLKRIENLEQRINDLHGSDNKVATLTYG
jgi:hypothetical protein